MGVSGKAHARWLSGKPSPNPQIITLYNGILLEGSRQRRSKNTDVSSCQIPANIKALVSEEKPKERQKTSMLTY